MGFRYFVQRHAVRLNLAGYARNLPNGDVEVTAEGPKDNLLSLIEELKRGPSFSRIDNVQAEWYDNKRSFENFTIRY